MSLHPLQKHRYRRRLMKKYDTIGIDCVAMNVNDIICIGATPVSFVDYIAANKNDQVIFKKIVEGLVKGAKKICNANCWR